MIVLNSKWVIFQLYHDKNKLHFDELMMMLFKLYKTNKRSPHCMLTETTDWHVTPLAQIMILSQPVFALTPSGCMLRKETESANYLFYSVSLTWQGPEPTIYCTWGKHAIKMMWSWNQWRRKMVFCNFSFPSCYTKCTLCNMGLVLYLSEWDSNSQL